MTAPNRATEPPPVTAPDVPFLPQPVTGLDVAFGSKALELLPTYGEIPEEFKRWRGDPWVDLISTWFNSGLRNLQMREKPGIDRGQALTHIKAIMGSFEPKHEHKIAGCAYLLSLWFEPGATWEAAK